MVFPTIAIFSAYWLMKECNIKWPFLWAGLVLASSHAFLYRMSMPRIQSISLACLLVTIYFVLKRRYLLLAILSFFFVWLYDAFIFAFVITLCFFASGYIMKKVLNHRMLIYCLAGIVIGILINPYFPHNIGSYIFNLTRTAAPAEVMAVGSEWRPYYTWFFATDSGLTLVVFFAAIVISLIKGTRLKADTLGLFFFSLLLLLMFLRSRRWVEYWPPFTVLFSAFLIRDTFECGMGNAECGMPKGNFFIPQSAIRNPHLVTLIVLVILLSFFLPRNFIEARREIKDSRRSDFFKGGAQWLKAHTEPKSIVFNTDWDDFPYLFIYNSDNYYIVGLAPDYMYYLDPQLYMKWKSITRGEVKNPSNAILQTFSARYVITDNGHADFIKKAKEDKNFKKEYQDSFCTVFSITRERGVDNEVLPR